MFNNLMDVSLGLGLFITVIVLGGLYLIINLFFIFYGVEKCNKAKKSGILLLGLCLPPFGLILGFYLYFKTIKKMEANKLEKINSSR